MLQSLALLALISPLAKAVIGSSPDGPPLRQCPLNMEYRVIGDLCEPTCAEPKPTCDIQLNGRSTLDSFLWPLQFSRCQCKRGFYRLFTAGPCVSVDKCNSQPAEDAIPKVRVSRAVNPVHGGRRRPNLPVKRSVARKMKRMDDDAAQSMVLEKTLMTPFASLIYGPVAMWGR